ncbi:MAG TPA: hypothetical protein VGP87_10900 [Gemmatimonadales bacterium]|jgi:hypothetical protein|nr:hypothetical protein [Gemmatimonadales bacterium]
MPFQRRLLALSLFLTPLACGLASTGPDDEPGPDPAATTRILFVGNSLTYVNDLPGMVKALADSSGISGVQTAMVAFPDYSLEDHWNNGQAGRVISKGGWHYVVMQQGPSAVPANRENLRQWVATFADLIRTKGGTPALYQIWPQLVNVSDFDASSESYRLAALDVGGLFLQAGNAWRTAWAGDASLALYAPDGLHASVSGTYLAALTVFGGLFHRSVIGVPRGLSVTGGSFQIPAGEARLLQQAADQVNGPLIHP